MKNQIQKLKTKLTGRGSILVYTLIIMMIMLATALSIFAVAVREKKGAGTTAASMQAFAVADSGSEIALQAADKNTAIDSLPGATSCNSTTGTVTINVAGGTADITFYSDEAADTALGCGVSAGSARKVKSVGRYGGTARAVEVAVAQAVEPVGTCYSKDEMLYIKFIGSCGSGWHQCTATEVNNAGGIGCLPSVSQYLGKAIGFLSGNSECLAAVGGYDYSPAWTITTAESCFSVGKACCLD